MRPQNRWNDENSKQRTVDVLTDASRRPERASPAVEHEQALRVPAFHRRLRGTEKRHPAIP